MAGTGILPESTFFNRYWLRNKTIFIFIFIFLFLGEGGTILRLQGSDDREYRTIPKILPWGLYFSKALFGGVFIRRGLCSERNLRFKIDWTSFILGRKFTVLLCFTAPGGKGTYIWRGDLPKGFCVTTLGGLYYEGLIFGILRYVLPRSQVSQVCLENGKLNCER